MSPAADRAELRDLIARYAQAVDRHDVPAIAACFATDAELAANRGGTTTVGATAIATYFEEAFSQRPLLAGGQSTHLLGNVLIDVTGDEARIETQAIACLAAPGRDTVTLRGLRYSDVCRREDGRWVIANRRHEGLWQCEAPGGLL